MDSPGLLIAVKLIGLDADYDEIEGSDSDNITVRALKVRTLEARASKLSGKGASDLLLFYAGTMPPKRADEAGILSGEPVPALLLLREIVGSTARTAYFLGTVPGFALPADVGSAGVTGVGADDAGAGGATPHDDAQRDFYAALASATLEGDTLRLPKGVYWRGAVKRGSSLYVRPCYPALYDWFCLSEQSDAVLLGTPGVGKSTAVFYFLWRLLNEPDAARRPEVIIYHPQQLSSTFVVFGGGRVFKCLWADVEALPRSNNVIQIFDGTTPLETDSGRRTWLVSSPRKDVWGEWQKQTDASIRCMPTFALSELLRCREVAFPHVPLELVECHHERWGGSARFVLALADSDSQRRLVEEATSAVQNADLVRALHSVARADGGGSKYGSGPHTLFHLAVLPDFSSCYPVFASDYCRDLVVSTLAEKGRAAVVSFLASSESTPSFGSLRGHLFERLALSTLLSQEQRLKLVALDGRGGESEEEPFLPRRLAVFKDVEELLRIWQRDPTAVGRPRNSNWPTWDAVTQDADRGVVTFWQFTVSAPGTHGLNSSGLVKAVPLVAYGMSARFIFVVHPKAGGPYSAARVAISGDARQLPAWAADMPQFRLLLEPGEKGLARVAADAAVAVREVGEEVDAAELGAGRRRHKARRPEEGLLVQQRR